MIISRRILPLAGATILGSATYMFYPPPIKADVKRYCLNDKMIEELNKRDHEHMVNGYLKHLSEWKPTTSYSKTLETMDSSILFNLYYISTMYEMPVKDYQKIKIRKEIQDFYKNTKSDKEKEMYLTILNYYKLLN